MKTYLNASPTGDALKPFALAILVSLAFMLASPLLAFFVAYPRLLLWLFAAAYLYMSTRLAWLFVCEIRAHVKELQAINRRTRAARNAG